MFYTRKVGTELPIAMVLPGVDRTDPLALLLCLTCMSTTLEPDTRKQYERRMQAMTDDRPVTDNEKDALSRAVSYYGELYTTGPAMELANNNWRLFLVGPYDGKHRDRQGRYQPNRIYNARHAYGDRSWGW